MGKIIKTSLFLLYLSPVGVLLAQAPQPVGNVLTTQGQVVAVDAAGVTRSLTRRAGIFAGEHIVTGPAGFIQIRMIDTGMIALGEATELVINQYALAGAGGNSGVVDLRLTRGSVRTIAGSIGETVGDQYRLHTAAATVSQAGATFGCAIELDKLYCGVYYNSITMENALGSVTLGTGSNWDYAEAEFLPVPIRPLLSMPSALGSVVMTTNTPQTNTPTTQTASQAPLVDFPRPQPIQVTPYKNSP